MKLSKRLMTIADLIDNDIDYLYDVGCDHAKLDIYITKTRQRISCIAIDVNENVIKTTTENIKSLGLDKKIKILKNDGLNNLEIPYNSVVVISGLGTKTILNILKVQKLPKYLILQSNNDEYFLRKAVIKLGYKVDSEVFVPEKGYNYVVTKFVKGKSMYSNFNYFVSPLLQNNIEYLKYRLEVLNKNYKYAKTVFDKIKYKIWIFKLENIIKKVIGK